MKRKIIKQGNDTLTITLPRKWARTYGIAPGSEIELEEREKTLVLSTEKEISLEKCCVNVADLQPMVRRTLFSLYQKGYDEINVTFNSSKEMSLIQFSVTEMIGMEIIDQVRKSISIKELAHPEYTEFDNILRKTFFLILNTSRESLEAAKKGDVDYLNTIAQRDKDVNKFTNFCRRALIKKGHRDFRKTAPMFFIVVELEKIGDVYRDLCWYIANNKIKISKDEAELFGQVNDFFYNLYELFYKFDLKKVPEAGERKDRITIMIENLYDKVPKKNMKILFYLNNISESIFDINGPLMVAVL
jgi:phosphate uptake regulator